ncbi:hypothetical protein J6590_023030 [Homalodisca vitripennis]|nr:hypothetical protein J6590_023030 [Homalodisca vitripennis]
MNAEQCADNVRPAGVAISVTPCKMKVGSDVTIGGSVPQYTDSLLNGWTLVFISPEPHPTPSPFKTEGVLPLCFI